MPRLSFLLSLCLLPFASGAEAQTPTPYPQADTVPIPTVLVAATTKTVRLDSDEVRHIQGSYVLANGWRLKVRPHSRYIDTTIDQQKPMRLLAVSSDKFVSGDGDVIMLFNRGDFNDEMLISYVPGPGLAQVIVGALPMAQR